MKGKASMDQVLKIKTWVFERLDWLVQRTLDKIMGFGG